MTSVDPNFAVVSERLARAWCNSWNAKDASALTACFTRDGQWTDHGFMVTRKGTTALAHHWDLWKHANPDFHVAEILAIWPTPVGCVLKYIGKGTMTGHLGNMYQPNGKTFEFHGYCDFAVNKEEGLIKTLDELYCKTYWDSRFSDYRYEEKI